jgi:hypothetical protein
MDTNDWVKKNCKFAQAKKPKQRVDTPYKGSWADEMARRTTDWKPLAEHHRQTHDPLANAIPLGKKPCCEHHMKHHVAVGDDDEFFVNPEMECYDCSKAMEQCGYAPDTDLGPGV